MSSLLFTALLNERQSPSEGVWIDQICINQKDDSEKQTAVNAMDVIYKCARAVVIILDDIELTSAEQVALRFYILEYEKVTGEGFVQPYYDDDPPYMTTNHPDSPPTIFRFTNRFMLHLIGLSVKAKLEMTKTWLVTVLTSAIDDNNGVKLRLGSFMQVFAKTFSQNAGGNPKIQSPEARNYDANLNKLSIAMNTISMGVRVSRRARDLEDGLPPPTEDECCRRFTIVALAASDPTALCTSGHELQTNAAQRSWMRWPLLADGRAYKLHWIGPWSMGFDPSFASRWIALNIAFFDRAGGLRWATEPRLKICAEFLESCANIGTMMQAIGGKKLDLPNKVGRDLIIKTLACVMDCGPEWITLTGGGEFETHKSQLMRAGLQMLLDSEEKMSREGSTAATVKWTADEHLEAQSLIDLACDLIYRGPAVETDLGQSMDFWEPACIANETGSTALTFVRRPPPAEKSFAPRP